MNADLESFVPLTYSRRGVQRLATTAPQAIAATKHLLAQVQSALPLPALLDDAAHLFARALRGPEAPQGLAAFTARKAPPWSPAA